MNDPLSAKFLLSALDKKGLISFQQARDLYDKRFELIKRFQQSKPEKVEDTQHGDRNDMLHLVDAIVCLNLKRKDDPSKTLDEDAIYKTTASCWKVPFVKIDPLKLELNIVTTTITLSFAKKHLVLPIEIDGGQLVIATPNPFNMEVFDDIARACRMKVRAV